MNFNKHLLESEALIKLTKQFFSSYKVLAPGYEIHFRIIDLKQVYEEPYFKLFNNIVKL